jgi:hypothetical protein
MNEALGLGMYHPKNGPNNSDSQDPTHSSNFAYIEGRKDGSTNSTDTPAAESENGAEDK